MSDFQAEYEQKKCTAQQAVQQVKSGDRIYVGTCSSIAYKLCQALEQREQELENVVISCSQYRRSARFFAQDAQGHFDFCSYFMGISERQGLGPERGEFTSVHLSQIGIWCAQTARPNVAFLEVSPCDFNGYMSFGASGVALHRQIADQADTVILQVNRSVPYVYGEDHLIHCSQADFIVEADDSLETAQELPADARVQAISRHIVALIPDGATIQLGLGGLASAVGYGLREKNDLGIHSELMSDVMMRLMKDGVVTNRRKTLFPGKSVASFAFGSEELYQFLDHNSSVYFLPFSKTNDPALIAQNENMISINTAMSIDLFGQVAADSLGFRQQSGTGGQLDFVRGAQLAKGGKSFFALTSTLEKPGRPPLSRIVSAFPAGTAVTTPRSDVQYIATEYGCVNLKPLSMRDRVRAMIGLAHPQFREQLKDQARQAGILNECS